MTDTGAGCRHGLLRLGLPFRELRGLLDTWCHPLAVGQPLPELPLWLTEEMSVTPDLQGIYEDTYRALRIR